MNNQPTIRGKQPNTHFTVKRQTMLTLVSNSGNLGSASSSFQLGVCAHNFFFSLLVQRTSNTSLKTIKHNRNARRPMPLHKRTPQGQASAITTMNSVQQCTTQQHSTNPPLVPVTEGSPHSNVLGTTKGTQRSVQFHNSSPKHG